MKFYFDTHSLHNSRTKAVFNYIKSLGEIIEISSESTPSELTARIDSADITIIEYTEPDFKLLYEIEASLFRKKPTLILLAKGESTNDPYFQSLTSPLLRKKEYDAKSYKDVIDEFISYNKVENGVGRYNIVLDKKHKFFLDWASTKYSKSKSAIIREALEQVMENNWDYKEFLGDLK